MTEKTMDGTLQNLAERYPFDQHELIILIRCQEHIWSNSDHSNKNFLLALAQASPFSHYFLPNQNELRDRVLWLENHILPPGFASAIRYSIAVDPFVDYANQGASKQLERFIEGVADTGRRGTREALGVLLRICPPDKADEGIDTVETATSTTNTIYKNVLDLVVRLMVADEALVSPTLDRQGMLNKVRELHPLIEALSRNASEYPFWISHEATFVRWAETRFPLITSPLSTFVHHLLFHSHPYPDNRVTLQLPQLDHDSSILYSPKIASGRPLVSPSLYALALMTSDLGGGGGPSTSSSSSSWHRLYSTQVNGRSFNRLEWSILGYAGATLLVIQTIKGEVLGAYTAVPWKESNDFYGSQDCFLLELEPRLRIHRPLIESSEAAGEDHFMFLHTSRHHHHHPTDIPCGLGFGGSLSRPRLFIPSSLEHCSAHGFDKTFESGSLLSSDAALERFEIATLEIWGTGGDSCVQKALQARREYRERRSTTLERARTVSDKHEFVSDFKSGLIPHNKI
mmetsp:Transcript_13945/g.30485  ORF Transcript_13945/g.30485 Transcript_13945/m.30485 type:complete len:514 (+) Transcript_13945:134-1675(+)